MADVDEPDAPDADDPDFGTLPAGDLDELTDEERDALNDADADASDEEDEFDLTPLFLEWVEEHLAVVEYTHSDKSTAVWCPEWWKHPEAVERLWAAFEARQQAKIDAAERADAPSDWWLTHWDRHAAILFDSKAGPFRNCDRNLGHLHDSSGPAAQRVPYTHPPLAWRRLEPGHPPNIATPRCWKTFGPPDEQCQSSHRGRRRSSGHTTVRPRTLHSCMNNPLVWSE